MAKEESIRAQAEILQKAFERLKRKNPAFSLRSAAKKLELSPSFLSRLLKGKTRLPLDRVDEFSSLFKLDKLSIHLLLDLHLDQKTTSLAAANLSSKTKRMRKYEELPETNLELLEKWYYVAILDLSGCSNFDPTPKALALRFGISEREAQGAMDFLINKKYLLKTGTAKYKKIMPHFRFPTTESLSYIRNYHKQMLRKAFEELEKTGQLDFDRRLITGISIAANPKKLQQAKDSINEAMYKIAEELNEGELQELYQLSICLWPLSK